MKLFNKYMFMALAAGATFTACDDEDNYAPGQPAKGGVEVNFDYENSSSVVMAIDDTDVTVTLTRTDANGTLIVPVKTVCAADILSAPESVTFQAGETTAQYTFKVTNAMEAFKSYLVSIIVDEAYSNPYKPLTDVVPETDTTNMTVTLYPRLNLTLLKEDYTTVFKGKFTSNFWEEEWESAIQYSEIKKLYRVNPWFDPAYHLYFSLGDDNKITPVTTKGKIATGLTYGSYGAISANYNEDIAAEQESYYDPETKTYHFYFEYTVSAGSFGTADDVFTVE